jgi:hypothetical protein
MTKKGYWKVPWREENTADVDDKKKGFKVRLKCLEKEACLGALESGETTELVTEENSMSLVAGTGTAYRNVSEGKYCFCQCYYRYLVKITAITNHDKSNDHFFKVV